MALYTYSARDLTIILGTTLYGKQVLTGLGPDEFLTLELNEDDWSEEESADGASVVRSLMPNTIVNGEITLQSTSPSNRLMTVLRNADKAAPGSGVFSFTLKGPLVPVVGGAAQAVDAISSLKVTSPAAYVKKLAPMPQAKTSGVRAWPVTLTDPIFHEDPAAVALAIGSSAANLATELGNIL